MGGVTAVYSVITPLCLMWSPYNQTATSQCIANSSQIRQTVLEFSQDNQLKNIKQMFSGRERDGRITLSMDGLYCVKKART